MKAITFPRYGSPDVLQLEEVAVPDVADDAVLVRVRAASVNATDWHSMRGKPIPVRIGDGLRRPKLGRLGVDVAGLVEAVGSTVTHLRGGDEVFGARNGAFAELVSGRNFIHKPANLSFGEAATIPVAATTALQALRDKGGLQSGQRVLITGASGGVSTFAVQIAKAFGAHVTAVCSTGNLEMVRSIGADAAIDYTRNDFTRSSERYDLVLDIAGSHPLTATRRLLATHGTLVVVGGRGSGWIAPTDRLLAALVMSKLGRQRITPFLAQLTRDDLVVLKELAESGKLRPVIDRTYLLSEIADAIRYFETMRARGKVVITVAR
ncbi:MAG: NAD(P)-dependent alcohol dehydrogenase [Chloroflexi bacterium]|nr:NAD(P)-dependent alcohol dehydrogenase [Chloroflexota bacterium]